MALAQIGSIPFTRAIHVSSPWMTAKSISQHLPEALVSESINVRTSKNVLASFPRLHFVVRMDFAPPSARHGPSWPNRPCTEESSKDQAGPTRA